MRTFNKLIAVAIMAATATAVAVVPAIADPPAGTKVQETDIVGVGSDTIQAVFNQFSVDYNASVKKTAPHLYSYDATDPKTGVAGGNITVKKNCPAEPRPNGSSAGILASAGGPLALSANLQTKDKKAFCTDFARSSRARAVGDPANIQFVPFALDAVTYATNPNSNAPANLSTAQLAEIYTCQVPAKNGNPANNWADLGGKKGAIDAQLPQTSSGTRKFFLTALGAGTPITPGPCVDSSKNESPNNLPEENEGVNKYLQGANVIYPYSAADYIAQVFHSAPCLNKSCTPNSKGVTCTPNTKKHQNLFGCDIHGQMQLRDINKTSPTVIVKKVTELNSKFTPAFVRQVFVVVRLAKGKPGGVPAYLQGLFGPKGWLFTSKAAHADILAYGFLPLP
jgi:ABC-type phosphate transport system substrate-binding protein